MSEKKPPSTPANDDCCYFVPKDFPTHVDGPSTHAEYKVTVNRNEPQQRDTHDTSIQPELLTLEEASQFLHIGKTLLYEMVRMERIPFIRVGSHYRFPRWKLIEWINNGGDLKKG